MSNDEYYVRTPSKVDPFRLPAAYVDESFLQVHQGAVCNARNFGQLVQGIPSRSSMMT
jgi:hypothetical protein